jgi:hypothetical protein
MRGGVGLALAAAAVSALLAWGGAGGAANERVLGWKTYVKSADGFRIDVPLGWQVVPPTIAGVQARIRQLRAQGRTALANQYSSLLGDPYTRKQVGEFRFQAFQWPARPSPITTDVTVKITPVPASLHVSDLPAVAAEVAKAFNGPRDRLEPIAKVRLPAGQAVRVRGVVHLDPSYGGRATGFTLYLLLQPRRLFGLSFRTDSQFSSAERPVFDSIARRFAFLR